MAVRAWCAVNSFLRPDESIPTLIMSISSCAGMRATMQWHPSVPFHKYCYIVQRAQWAALIHIVWREATVECIGSGTLFIRTAHVRIARPHATRLCINNSQWHIVSWPTFYEFLHVINAESLQRITIPFTMRPIANGSESAITENAPLPHIVQSNAKNLDANSWPQNRIDKLVLVSNLHATFLRSTSIRPVLMNLISISIRIV